MELEEIERRDEGGRLPSQKKFFLVGL